MRIEGEAFLLNCGQTTEAGSLTLSLRVAPKGDHLADRGFRLSETSVIIVFN